jgi:hypothetical protein
MTELAVTAAVAGAIQEDDEPEQLGLFGEPESPEGMRLAVNRGRGPGRPPGARNKRTERTVRFLMSRHRDPREVLLEIAEANVFDLAALLGCSPHEAMQEKRLAAIGVLPYVAARITPEVLNDNRQVVHLTIHEGRSDAALAGGTGATATVLQNVEYQEVEPDAPDAL